MPSLSQLQPLPPTTPHPFELKMIDIIKSHTDPLLAQIALLQAERWEWGSKLADIEAKLAVSASSRDHGFFVSAELSAMSFDLEPTVVTSWLIIHFLPAVKTRNSDAHAIISVSDAEWDAVKA